MRESERQLASVYHNNSVHYSTIKFWYHKFQVGNYSLKDEPRSGRPMETNLTTLAELIEDDPFQSTREIAKTLGITHATVENGLAALGKVKKLGRFIPHNLTKFDYDRRVDACTLLLTLHNGTRWLDHLVTGDEKWVLYSNHHRRAQWVDASEPAADVPKPELHMKKVLLSIWWTVHGPLHWDLLPSGVTITADVYSKQLKILQQKLTLSPLHRHRVYFLHDNARPHVARKVKSDLSRFGWTVLPHPPYSPDLAPSDYWLFADMQRHLEGNDFKNVDEIKTELKRYFDSRPAGFWKDGIHKLPERWQHVVDHDGAYC
ncbi:hypothetical protein B9Z55_027134 [Caenorhabditis nigoni]|uniref:Mos1 transposase HTH domain-containing protein n=1 Tax=Caenorhabditis nigoni TaxID=1611254 RepID=A0A2G5SJ25_9PELO|nr:hypothetical protein B9Z55_027134 [Caenorhabditis nigoni]